MAALQSLCPELLQSVLEKVDVDDLATLMLTCHALYDFIKDNQLLWRELYLLSFVSILIT